MSPVQHLRVTTQNFPQVIEAREPTLFQSSFKASHQGQALDVSWKGVLPQQQLFWGVSSSGCFGCCYLTNVMESSPHGCTYFLAHSIHVQIHERLDQIHLVRSVWCCVPGVSRFLLRRSTRGFSGTKLSLYSLALVDVAHELLRRQGLAQH